MAPLTRFQLTVPLTRTCGTQASLWSRNWTSFGPARGEAAPPQPDTVVTDGVEPARKDVGHRVGGGSHHPAVGRRGLDTVALRRRVHLGQGCGELLHHPHFLVAAGARGVAGIPTGADETDRQVGCAPGEVTQRHDVDTVRHLDIGRVGEAPGDDLRTGGGGERVELARDDQGGDVGVGRVGLDRWHMVARHRPADARGVFGPW